MLVNILTAGPKSYNARAFLYPIVLHRQALEQAGIYVEVFERHASSIEDCDILIIDSKYFKYWYLSRTSEMYKLLEHYSSVVNLLFFDTTDSGYVLGDVLPYVKKYIKHQILARAVPSAFIWSTTFFHLLSQRIWGRRRYQVRGKKRTGSKMFDLSKIHCGWNTGLANYTLLRLLWETLQAAGMDLLAQKPQGYYKEFKNRTLNVQCRMNTEYSKATVAFQRRQLSSILADKVQTNKLNRYSFFKELGNAKTVISPFGLGEITLKDFETFIMGALLLKPNMDSIVTWPDFYVPGETYIPFSWDLSDINEVIGDTLIISQ